MGEASAAGMSARQLSAVAAMLRRRGEEVDVAGPLQVLRGDGSDRRFFRLGANPSWLVVMPDPHAPKGLAEARAAAAIGRHLHGRGVAVPEIVGFDEESGLMLCEDLGDRLLHAEAEEARRTNSNAGWLAFYRQALTQLTILQVRGREGFQADWCWDTVHYDRQLMLERESGYFLRAFYHDYLGRSAVPVGLEEEFHALAAQVAAQPNEFLLHRDFQSRNLMLRNGRVRIIDFQGARFGPLAYDLASLLLDPYVGLSQEEQQGLLDDYLARLRSLVAIDEQLFRAGYQQVAVQRNLQIIGAFAFLSQRKKKRFFQPYLAPALRSLHSRLAGELAGVYPVLQAMVAEISGSFRPRA